MRSGFPKINRSDLGAYKFPLPNKKYQKQVADTIIEKDAILLKLDDHRRRTISLRPKYLSRVLGLVK
jgi:restriction endonuclease S subunit